MSEIRITDTQALDKFVKRYKAMGQELIQGLAKGTVDT